MSPTQTWFCAQMGGREHYAIPRALYSAQALGGLMTDFWAGTLTKGMVELLPGKLWHSIGARCHPDIPSNLVESSNLRAFVWEASLRGMARRGGVKGRYLGYCEVGRRFAQAVTRCMKARRSLPENSVFFGYDTCSLEVMEHFKQRGVACIVDQIDPCRVEVEMVQGEHQAWPGWEEHPLDVPDEFFERHINEWAIADRVVVNSEFSRKGLMQQGVPGDKIVVIPLGFGLPAGRNGDPSEGTNVLLRIMPKSFTRENPLRVLFLGQVMLRKGIQYLVEAAKLLQHEPVHFDIVGPIHITNKAVSSVPPNLVFHGRATRDQIGDWYRRADVFVLPTLSDGFAITQIEAMANGLPVIATPNCGAVVSDGVDGFIVPPRDPHLLAHAIHRYLEEPDCLENQHRAARQKVGQFSLQRTSRALLQLACEIQL